MSKRIALLRMASRNASAGVQLACRVGGASRYHRTTFAAVALRLSSLYRGQTTATNKPPNEDNGQGTKRLTAEQLEYLDRALRVNHAGELAATLIYAAQNPIITKEHPRLRLLMKHMYDQEAGHFKFFNELLAKHRVRPTALYPMWQIAATGLGWATAMMGREAAMACTEAVETEIGDHYNDQVRTLFRWKQEFEAEGQTMSNELLELMDRLRRIRDEELEHLDHAVAHDSKKATPYEVLTNVIRLGCRYAIRTSERI